MKGSEEKKALKEALEKSDIKKIPTENLLKMEVFVFNSHCVKSIYIRSFFWSVFSRIRTE